MAPHDDVRDLLLRWIRATQPIEVVLHDPYLAQVVDAEPVAVLPNEDLYVWALRRGLSECTALGQLGLSFARHDKRPRACVTSGWW